MMTERGNMTPIDFQTIIPIYDAILSRGLCAGVGQRDGQMCIEAAICAALGLPHGDNPECVAPAIRAYKITLNDAPWSTPEARASGLHDIGLAQIGSRGVVDDMEFSNRLAEKTIRELIPKLFREMLADYPACLAAADRCESEGTATAARAAAEAAEAAARAARATAEIAACATEATAWAAEAVVWAASCAARAAAAAEAAIWYTGTAWAARAATEATAWAAGDAYLLLSAKLALEVLRELKSPGCEWI